MNTYRTASRIGTLLLLLAVAIWTCAPAARSQTPSVSVFPTTVVTGDTATISWTNGPGNPGDCIAVCNPDGSSAGWCYLNGTTSEPANSPTSGSLTLEMPALSGSCTVEFFSGVNKTKIASCVLTTAPVGSIPHVNISRYFNAGSTYKPSDISKVNLSLYFNIVGIYSDGSYFTGGMDGSSNALSAYSIAASQTWTAALFTLGHANQQDAVSSMSQSITLPAGKYHALGLLATSVLGSKPGQKFTVTYTDGTFTAFTQSVSDWYFTQGYANESTGISMPYRLEGTGAKDNRTFHIYVYSIPLDSTKTVKSLILPNNKTVIVFAASLVAP